MDVKIELIPVPVTDVDRAIDFYTNKAGFNLDHDFTVKPGLRFVQITPPGSACSIVIGDGITDKQPGTQEIQCVVKDSAKLREELVERGVEASEVETMPWGIFVHYRDPDGNKWSMQQIVPQQTA